MTTLRNLTLAMAFVAMSGVAFATTETTPTITEVPATTGPEGTVVVESPEGTAPAEVTVTTKKARCGKKCKAAKQAEAQAQAAEAQAQAAEAQAQAAGAQAQVAATN